MLGTVIDDPHLAVKKNKHAAIVGAIDDLCILLAFMTHSHSIGKSVLKSGGEKS